MLIGGTNSGTSLSMSKVAAEKKKYSFLSVPVLQSDQRRMHAEHHSLCLRYRRAGQGHRFCCGGETRGKSWYFLTADYAFGASLESDTASVVKALAAGVRIGQTSFVCF
jgi:branched-chain amino acid transport system substrate-binding protein